MSRRRGVQQFRLAVRCTSSGLFCIPSKRADFESLFDECSSCNKGCVRLFVLGKFQILISANHSNRWDNASIPGTTVSRSFRTPLGIKAWLQIRFGQDYTLIRHLLPPARTFNWGFIFLAKIPTGNRLDCLRATSALVAPHKTYLTNSA